MRNKTVNFTARLVNRSKPVEFQQVNPSFRLVSPSARMPEAELRVVRHSQVEAARTNNFPASNLNGGSTYVQDEEKREDDQDQSANSNGKNEHERNTEDQHQYRSSLDSLRKPRKAEATPQSQPTKGIRSLPRRVPFSTPSLREHCCELIIRASDCASFAGIMPGLNGKQFVLFTSFLSGSTLALPLDLLTAAAVRKIVKASDRKFGFRADEQNEERNPLWEHQEL